MQLNFSDTLDKTVNMSSNDSLRSNKRKADDNVEQSVLKKHRDSVTGLDVCRIIRDKDTELADSKATIAQLKTQLSAANTMYNKLNLQFELSMDTLSMGMSGDYELAIDHGSTMIRVGSAIFGKRNY